MTALAIFTDHDASPTLGLSTAVRSWPQAFRRSKAPGVIAGLVPGDLDQDSVALDYRDGRDKPGHDQAGTATTFPCRACAGTLLDACAAVDIARRSGD